MLCIRRKRCEKGRNVVQDRSGSGVEGDLLSTFFPLGDRFACRIGTGEGATGKGGAGGFLKEELCTIVKKEKRKMMKK
jgi:hypothetical protein